MSKSQTKSQAFAESPPKVYILFNSINLIILIGLCFFFLGVLPFYLQEWLYVGAIIVGIYLFILFLYGYPFLNRYNQNLPSRDEQERLKREDLIYNKYIFDTDGILIGIFFALLPNYLIFFKELNLYLIYAFFIAFIISISVKFYRMRKMGDVLRKTKRLGGELFKDIFNASILQVSVLFGAGIFISVLINEAYFYIMLIFFIVLFSSFFVFSYILENWRFVEKGKEKKIPYGTQILLLTFLISYSVYTMLFSILYFYPEVLLKFMNVDEINALIISIIISMIVETGVGLAFLVENPYTKGQIEITLGFSSGIFFSYISGPSFYWLTLLFSFILIFMILIIERYKRLDREIKDEYDEFYNTS